MERWDVVFAGGGMVGLSLAIALARSGLKVAVADRETPEAVMALDYDSRASAIALGSKRVLDGAGVWEEMASEASPIWDIRVVDGHPLRGVSPLFLHYDHADVGEEPFGWILENRITRQALHKVAARTEGLTLFAPASVSRIDRDLDKALAVLDTGEEIEASLAIAADGKFSKRREEAGIKISGWAYDQVSMVATVQHERSHDGVAVELFLPGGPFAMLPMTNNRSNVVWSEQKDRAKQFMAMDDDAFLAELKLRFGDWLGDVKLTGPRFSYPLSLQQAERYTDTRFALIGDAAHAMHPIAGQGLNMGLRDVAAFAQVLVDAHRLGLDIGSQSVLRDYERRRRFDNVTLGAVTDGLLRLFSNDVPPIRLARDVGLAAVNRLPPVKKLLMRHAMGVVGELPRMVKGEAL